MLGIPFFAAQRRVELRDPQSEDPILARHPKW